MSCCTNLFLFLPLSKCYTSFLLLPFCLSLYFRIQTTSPFQILLISVHSLWAHAASSPRLSAFYRPLILLYFYFFFLFFHVNTLCLGCSSLLACQGVWARCICAVMLEALMIALWEMIMWSEPCSLLPCPALLELCFCLSQFLHTCVYPLCVFTR